MRLGAELLRRQELRARSALEQWAARLSHRAGVLDAY
jgi:hypothetical protein